MGKSNKPTKWFKAVKKAFRSPSKERPPSPDHQDTKADADEKLLCKQYDHSPVRHPEPTPHPLPSFEIITHDEGEPEHSRVQQSSFPQPLPTPEAVDPAIASNQKVLENVIEEEEENTTSNDVGDVQAVANQQQDDDDDSVSEEEEAAARIQQRFSEPLALNGLIRLQALVRGHQVRRQAATTLTTMEAIVRVQAVFRGRRIRMSKDGRAVRSRISKRRRLSSRAGHHVDATRGGLQFNEPQIIRFEQQAFQGKRPTAYFFTQQLRRSAPNRSSLFIDCDPGQPHWGWEWLELWSYARPWEIRTVEGSKDSKDFIEIIPSRKNTSEYTTKEVDVNTLKVKYYEDYVSNPTPPTKLRSSNPMSEKKETTVKSSSPMYEKKEPTTVKEKKEPVKSSSPMSEKREPVRSSFEKNRSKEPFKSSSSTKASSSMSEKKEPTKLPEKKEPIRSSRSSFPDKKASSSSIAEKKESMRSSLTSAFSEKKESVKSPSSQREPLRSPASSKELARSPSSTFSEKIEPDYVVPMSSPTLSSPPQSHRVLPKPPPIEVPGLESEDRAPIPVLEPRTPEAPKSPVREKSLPPSPAVSENSLPVPPSPQASDASLPVPETPPGPDSAGDDPSVTMEHLLLPEAHNSLNGGETSNGIALNGETHSSCCLSASNEDHHETPSAKGSASDVGNGHSSNGVHLENGDSKSPKVEKGGENGESPIPSKRATCRYMVPTESAKAKFRSSSNPKTRAPETPESPVRTTPKRYSIGGSPTVSKGTDSPKTAFGTRKTHSFQNRGTPSPKAGTPKEKPRSVETSGAESPARRNSLGGDKRWRT